jgi:hypothetical protein
MGGGGGGCANNEKEKCSALGPGSSCTCNYQVTSDDTAL